jgi:glycerophosphoryl diester phosphodiesterase
MAYLKTLDVGHGYTADGGKTFPFRDKAVGAMPTLAEVLAAFPHARFLVNTKSRDPSEAEKLDAYLRARPALNAARLTFFSDGRLADRLRALRPDARITNRDTLASCAAGYVALGWLGAVPAACRNTIVFVPANLAWIAWGWPNRFLARMRAVGTEVCVVAPLRRGVRPGGGLDDVKALAALPRNWRGCVSTDAVEIVGPALKSPTT